MAQPENKSLRPSDPAATDQAILMATQRFGSWEVNISRRPFSSEALASRYDAVSDSWGRTARRFRLESAYQEPLLISGVATAIACEGPQARILDCGVGSGSLSIALDRLLAKPVEYHGIDTSAEMLAQANTTMLHAGLRVQLKQADVLSLPYDDQSFDVVMAAHVLEHLPDPRRALKEMIRVLKPCGMVFVCATRRSLFGAFVQLIWRTWAITEQQGVAWLHDCQLADVGCQPIHLGSCGGVASTAFWARRPK